MNKRRRLKVAVVTCFSDAHLGFLDFRYRIEALGRVHDVSLWLRHERAISEFDAPGLEPRVVAHPNIRNRASLIAYTWRVSSRLRRERPDVIILLGASLAMCVYWLRGLPALLYWNEHPSRFLQSGRWGVLSYLFRTAMFHLAFGAAARASTVMPIGEEQADDLLAHGVPRERVQLIPMGVDDSFVGACLGTSRPADTPLRLIYTGSVTPTRGRDVMLEGLAKAVAAGLRCRLTFVGARADQIAYCDARAAELGISNAFKVIGRVPGHAIPQLLREADVGICIWEDQPWWRFNPPTKLFEYLAAGLPVAASDIRTHTRHVEEGRNGWVFDYSADGFAQALARMAASIERLPEMARAAAADGSRYRWSAIEPDFLDLVDRSVPSSK